MINVNSSYGIKGSEGLGGLESGCRFHSLGLHRRLHSLLSHGHDEVMLANADVDTTARSRRPTNRALVEARLYVDEVI